MDKNQILAAVLVGILVAGIAVYRLLWMGSAAAAGAGVRRFPRTPGKLLRWIFGQHGHSSSSDGGTATDPSSKKS
jgi:hypothetical protein